MSLSSRWRWHSGFGRAADAALPVTTSQGHGRRRGGRGCVGACPTRPCLHVSHVTHTSRTPGACASTAASAAVSAAAVCTSFKCQRFARGHQADIRWQRPPPQAAAAQGHNRRPARRQRSTRGGPAGCAGEAWLVAHAPPPTPAVCRCTRWHRQCVCATPFPVAIPRHVWRRRRGCGASASLRCSPACVRHHRPRGGGWHRRSTRERGSNAPRHRPASASVAGYGFEWCQWCWRRVCVCEKQKQASQLSTAVSRRRRQRE